MIDFIVQGIPRPKGSKRAFVLPNSQRAIITESNAKDLKPWLSDVRYLAQQKLNGQPPFQAAVCLTLSFAMPKPKSYPKRRLLFAVKRPDLDKLTRAICDALKGVVYRDDAQVVHLLVKKEYGDCTGVRITAWEPEAPNPFDWTLTARAK